jgi:putative transposase
MPHREELITGEIYHIILRALDDNLIFKDINDYYRGIFSIYEFNNDNSVEIWRRRRDRIAEKKREKMWEVGSPTILDKRDRFVDVLAFCFMPNHVHLLLKQIKNEGVSKFMQKIGGGYGRYFNDKYKRKGYVFQNRFKSVHIQDDKQLMIVVPYIFTNPVALIEPGWKEHGVKNHSIEKIIKFLKDYKWSSYQDCIGMKNFSSVTQRDFLLEAMGDEQGLKDAIKNWIEYKNSLEQSNNLFLE